MNCENCGEKLATARRRGEPKRFCSKPECQRARAVERQRAHRAKRVTGDNEPVTGNEKAVTGKAEHVTESPPPVPPPQFPGRPVPSKRPNHHPGCKCLVCTG